MDEDNTGRCTRDIVMYTAPTPRSSIDYDGADGPVDTNEMERVIRRCVLDSGHDGPHMIETPMGGQMEIRR
ncbi:hypothetical protein SEA_SOOS_24 [Gordonia phage Soos]|nr:hypothetical protein SEA_SOOS_24 [Gordonia phage Soos]